MSIYSEEEFLPTSYEVLVVSITYANKVKRKRLAYYCYVKRKRLAGDR